MRRPFLALGLIAAIAAILAAAGCGTRKTTLGPDLPPETSVYIQGAIDTVNHRVHLYWFGSDPDGYVVAYQMRFVPTRGDPNPTWETVYCGLPGRCTDSVFTVGTGDSALIHSQFEIRAMDDKGMVDPTPAIQRFVLSNQAPTVRITNKLRWFPLEPAKISDSSFASVTVSWEVDDPDGGGPGLRYRLWLDGNQSAYDSTTANVFTVPSARFLKGGRYLSGPRTVYLQGVDDGGRSGNIDSTTWYVRAPAFQDPVTHRGRLLVIDDSRRTNDNSNDFGVDTLYANTVARAQSIAPQNDPYNEGTLRYIAIPPGSYSIMRLEFSNPFRFANDLMQTFRLFDAVVWYRGYEVNIATTMQSYQDSIGEYIQGGGRLLLEGLYLFDGRNSFGALREDFVTRYLNCRRLYQQYNANTYDSTVELSVVSLANLHSTMYADTLLRMQRPAGVQDGSSGLRAFVVNDAGQVAATADTLALSGTTNHEPVPFAMSVNRYPGRLIVVPFPVRALAPPPGNSRAQFPSFRMLSRLLFDNTNGLLAP